MSYIRCLSNPEGLYIWPEKGGLTMIKIVGRSGLFEVPTKNFESVLRQWSESFSEILPGNSVKSGKLSIKEEIVSKNRPFQFVWIWDTFLHLFFPHVAWRGTAFSERMHSAKLRWDMNSKIREYKWALYNGDLKICEMWTTTMFYLAKSNAFRWTRQPKNLIKNK
jgi:hypothetical protein